MLITLIFLLLWDAGQTSMMTLKRSVNYLYGRTYMVSLQPLNWTEAQNMCIRNGGQLALIHELTTVPDMEIQENGTFWVGIRWNGTTIGNKMWANWASKPVLGNGSLLCAFVSVEPPYSWYATDCSSRRPYICEVRNGSCFYIPFKGMALEGFDRAFRSGMTLDQCKQICDDSSLGFMCQSFEYNKQYSYCNFNDWNRWTAPGYFKPNRELDYYHRTCCHTVLMDEIQRLLRSTCPNQCSNGWITKVRQLNVPAEKTTTDRPKLSLEETGKDIESTTRELDISSVPDDTTIPLKVSSELFSHTETIPLEVSSELFSSTDTIDQSSTPVISSSYSDVSHGPTLFCTQMWFDDQSRLVSQTFSSALLPSVTPATVSQPPASTDLVESLQDLSKDIKERRKLLKKISVPDYRASSISIGTIAIILLVGLILTIVVLDAPALGRHCIALHRNLCPHCCKCPARTKVTASSTESPKIVIATLKGTNKSLTYPGPPGNAIIKSGKSLVQEPANKINELPNDSVSNDEITRL